MNWKFGVIHWILTLVAGPIIPTIYFIIQDRQHEYLQATPFLYVFNIMLGLVLSLPTVAIYLATLTILKHLRWNEKFKKSMLIAISILGVFITSTMIAGETIIYLQVAGYAASALVIGLLLKWDIDSTV